MLFVGSDDGVGKVPFIDEDAAFRATTPTPHSVLTLLLC